MEGWIVSAQANAWSGDSVMGASTLFRPGLISFLLSPFFHARFSLWRFISRVGGRWSGRMLDVGCGGRPYHPLFSPELEQIGLDIDQERNRNRGRADVFYDGSVFPFEDANFDSILCSQVLEHVFAPEQFVSEVARVLKPGGEILLTVPFVWPEHEQPWDAMRYTSYGLRSLLERHRFEILVHEKSVKGLRCLVQIAQARIDQVLWRRVQGRTARIIVRLAFGPFHVSLNTLGALLAILPSFDEDLYLDNLVYARKKP